MWMDERGVAHTVALPNPAQLMSDVFRASLDALSSSCHDEVSQLLERIQEDIYGQVLSMPVDPAFEGVPPPVGLLGTEVWSVEGLQAALEDVDLRWRLDAVLALDDYIDLH